MDYNTITFLAALVLLGAGLLGVLITKEGRPALLIENRYLRITLAFIGAILMGWNMWQNRMRGEPAQTVIKDVTPELASYLAGCASEVEDFNSKYPLVPYKGTVLRTVFLTEDGTDGKPLDDVLEAYLLQHADPQSDVLPAVVSGPGTGKSTVIKALRKKFCDKALNGDLGIILLARDSRQLSDPAQRDALEIYLKGFGSDLPGLAKRKILLLDSLDELYTASAEGADVLVKWAAGLGRSYDFAVYLFSRPYAVEGVVAALKGSPKLQPILTDFHPNTEFYTKALYAIEYRRLSLGVSSSQGGESTVVLKKRVKGASEKLDKFLGSPWLVHAQERTLTFRDLEAILDAIEAKDSQTQLGDVYYAYARRRLQRDLRVEIDDNAAGTLLNCLGSEMRDTKLDRQKPGAPTALINNAECRVSIEYVDDKGQSRTGSAGDLLKASHTNTGSIDGLVQDVSAGIGLCLLPAGAPDGAVSGLRPS